MSFKLPRLGSSQCRGTCSERGHGGTVLQIVSESYGIFVWELVSGEKLLFIYFSLQQQPTYDHDIKKKRQESILYFLVLHSPWWCHKEASPRSSSKWERSSKTSLYSRKLFLKEAVNRMINTVSVGLFIFLRLLHQSPRWKIKIWKWPLHSSFKACVCMVHNIAKQVVATNGLQWFT